MPDTRKAAAAQLRKVLADDPDCAMQEMDPALILAAIRPRPSTDAMRPSPPPGA